MAAYADPSTLWDLSQAQSFSQLPDDDFLALLQKQFPTNPSPSFLNPPSVDPQSLEADMFPESPSDGDSPPPSASHKRKASDDDQQEGPSSKSKHFPTSDIRFGSSNGI